MTVQQPLEYCLICLVLGTITKFYASQYYFSCFPSPVALQALQSRLLPPVRQNNKPVGNHYNVVNTTPPTDVRFKT